MAFNSEEAFKKIVGLSNKKEENKEEQEQVVNQSAPKEEVKTEPKKEGMSKGILQRGRPKTNSETKQRISLAILPSVYDKVKKIAYVNRTTFSEVISEYLDKYIQEHEEELSLYDEYKNK